MKKITATITVQNKKYPYTLIERGGDVVFVECKGASIAQEFPKEDVASLLVDLPNLIVAEQEYEKSSTVIRFRVNATEKNQIDKKAIKEGFSDTSKYLRFLVLKSESLAKIYARETAEALKNGKRYKTVQEAHRDILKTK